MFNSIDEAKGEVIRSVGRLCAAAAVTAPKSGGQLFLRGKPLFIETVLVDDHETLLRLAGWMRRRGRERRQEIWLRDAALAERLDGVLFIGLTDWYPPIYDCGACGFATCAEFTEATRQRRADSDVFEFKGRNAICATSTWGSRSVRPPRRRAFTAWIRAARPELPSPPVSLVSFNRKLRSHCR